MEGESCVEYCFRNKIAFIPPNMCSVRLRHNLATFNKYPFMAFQLKEKKVEHACSTFKSCLLNYKEP